MSDRHARRHLRIASRCGAADHVPLPQIRQRRGLQGRTRGPALDTGPVPHTQGRGGIAGCASRGVRPDGDQGRHRRHTRARRLHRPAHPPRVQCLREVHPGQHQDPGARPCRGSLPCVRRQGCRYGDSMERGPRLEDAVSRGVQRHGEPPGRFLGGRGVPSRDGTQVQAQGRGDQGRRAHPCAHKRRPGDERGLGHRVRRPHRRRPHRGLPGRGHILHQHPRVPSHRRHRDEGYGACRQVRRHGRLRRRLRQRLHPLRRWLPLRQGRGGWDQHQQDPRPRAGGDGGPDDLQVRPRREWTGRQGLRRSRCEAFRACPVEHALSLREGPIWTGRSCSATLPASW